MKEIHNQIGAVAAPLTTLGEEIGSEVQASLRKVANRSVANSGRLRRAIIAVQSRPFGSVLLAFGVGMILGTTLRKI